MPNDSSPGDILLAIHDFIARSSDELSLSKGDRIELIERDDDFGDGWFLGRHTLNGKTGLFPEVYTRSAPKGSLATSFRRPAAPGVVRPTETTNGATHSFSSPTIRAVQPSGQVTPPALKPISRSNSTASAASQEPRNNMPRVISTSGPRNVGLAYTNDNSHNSPIMNETLGVINEHITDLRTPRHSLAGAERNSRLRDSSSEYSAPLNRLSYITGAETDDDEHTGHTAAEVLQWTPQQVAEYLEDVGVERKHCEVFKEQEVSGEVLLEMDQEAIFLREFDLGPVGRRLKTWHKIKSLQQEVRGPRPPESASGYAPSEDSVDNRRERSTSFVNNTVLPRIPSLNEAPGTRTSSITQRSSTQWSAQPGPPSLITEATSNPSPIADLAPRPSAQQVRDLGHSRRHSSIDHAPASVPQSPVSPTLKKSVSPTATMHKKLPSFDRNWTMGGANTTDRSATMTSVQPPHLNGLAPISHMHNLSTSGTQFDATTHELGMTVVSPDELDRGYFSGGEIDNRKAGRNVLRKMSSPYNNMDYMGDSQRRSGAFKHLRTSSTDSARDVVAPMSPAAKNYYSQGKKGSRTLSGPDILGNKPMHSAKDLPPTVTKLDYSDSPSLNAIANSPSIGRGSPSPALFPRTRSTGLRAISDAVTGNEKTLAATPAVSYSPLLPNKESPMASPARTGSTTPSGTSMDESLKNSLSITMSPNSTGPMTPSFGTQRRGKTKKETSAYTRGLEKKTPQEQLKDCDYSGWMKKKSSHLMTTWKTRLFVLRGRRLSYYYSESDTEEKGLIDISSHRVLPASNERIQGLHATLTGAAASPTSPHNSTALTTASADIAMQEAEGKPVDHGSIFIFKLVPPRSGLSKAVNFTKPTVHYFAVDSVQEGRLWMAALMKATIDRDTDMKVVTTYSQKTISLTKARMMKQRPPALKDVDEETADGEPDTPSSTAGLGLRGVSEKGASVGEEFEKSSVNEGSSFFTQDSTPESTKTASQVSIADSQAQAGAVS